MLSSATLLAAQNPEYDFYPESRNSFTPKLRAQNASLPMTQEQIVERYAAKLREEGVRETEITRRVTLPIYLASIGWDVWAFDPSVCKRR